MCKRFINRYSHWNFLYLDQQADNLYLDEKDAVNHEADIVFSDGTLIGDWNGHFLKAVNVGDAVHLHVNSPCCRLLTNRIPTVNKRRHAVYWRDTTAIPRELGCECLESEFCCTSRSVL